MALPVIRAAANKASSSVMDSFKNVASQAFIEPFRPLFKNQVIDTIKEIKSDAQALADKQKDDLEQSLESYNELNEGIESLDNSSNEQLEVLRDILEQITLHKELFMDQMTKAASDRALASRADREAAIEDAAAAPAVALSEEDKPEKKGRGLMGGIMNFLKGGFMKLAFFAAIPLLIAFFNSDTFKMIGDYLKDKWPAVKEFYKRTFGNFFLFFDDLKEIFTKFFSGDTTTKEKIEALLFELPEAIFNFLRRQADTIVALFGKLIGKDFGERPVTDFLNAITDSVTEAFEKVKNFVTSLPNKIGEAIDELIGFIPEPIRKLMNIRTASEIKADAAGQRFEADSKMALTVDEQRQIGKSNLDKGPTVQQQELERMNDAVPDLGINVEQLSNRDRRLYNRAVQQLQQKRIDEETFREKVSRFVPDQVTAPTSQIAEQSMASQQTVQPAPVIITDNRSTVQDLSLIHI